MRILVLGAGSIGSVFGALLHEAGHAVYLLGKGPHIEAVMRDGLLVDGIWGDHRVTGISAGDSLQRMLADGFTPEWTLLAVKSYDTREAVEELVRLMPEQRGIATCQNGLGNVEAVAAAAPGKAVGGRIIFGATTVAPGHVEVTVCADDVLLGPAYDGPAGVPALCEAIDAAGIPCRFEARILSFIWDKVLYNVCLNALATVLRTDYGTLGDDPCTRAIMQQLVRESYAVAAAEGVELVSPDPEAYMTRFRDELLPPTRGHRSSMQEDIEQRRRTEIESLNGEVWRMAERHGIETPANELLTRMVRFLELHNLS